jgi:hypothetical protein
MNVMISINRATSIFDQLVKEFASRVERHKLLFVLGYSAFFLLVCGLLSATKLLWYDEMAVYYPAKLPTVAAVVDFFWKGLDVHTPTASLVLRGTMALFGDGPVVDRMPFVLGYLICCICIFVFVARRCPAVYAGAAMIFPTLTLMFYYATEIRCYGLELGLTGIALVCWQAVEDGKWRWLSLAGLFLSLAAAVCCHYYAVFLVVPFGLAELTRAWLRKRIDWPVWLALVLSPLVVLLFLPAIRNARALYAGGMLAVQPHLGQIAGSYLYILSISNAPILGVIVACLLLAPILSRGKPDSFSNAPAADWVLAGSLALLPVYVVPASLVIGAFHERYILPCVAGVAIFLALTVCRALKADRLVGSLLLLFFLGWFAVKNMGDVRRQAATNGGLRTPLGQPLQNADWMRVLTRSDLPVAIAPAVLFMTVQHYAPNPARERIYYLADTQGAQRYGDIPSNEKNLLFFSSVLPLRVVDFRQFVSRQPHFLLCMESEHANWLIPALLEANAHLQLRNRFGPYFVFEVTMP